MFVDAPFAARLERAEARLSADVAEAARSSGLVAAAFVEPIGGGVAAWAGDGAPVNKITGVGFEGGPDLDRLAAVEACYHARRSAIQVEVATLADPSWHECLAPRGYGVAGFEHVLGLPLAGGGAADGSPAPGGAGGRPTESIRMIECQDPHDIETWIDVVATGFEHPDEVPAAASGQEFPRAVIEETFRAFARAPGFTRYLAFVDDEVAGGATLRVFEGVAGLCGAATLPHVRRRGVQTALFQARLDVARRLGCDVAVVTTAPGSPSQQNAERRGFRLLYARALHRREA